MIPSEAKFTKEELAEICKWAEVMGYQGTAKDLEKALAMNRGIVVKCTVGLRGMTEDERIQRECDGNRVILP